jgi:signal transduction histidine kinase
MTGPSPLVRDHRRPLPRVSDAVSAWPLGRMVAVVIAVMALFSMLAIIAAGVALANLSDARSLVVSKIDPAAFQASQLEVALLNQETGVRGYALSARPGFLAPYTVGVAAQRRALGQLRQLLAGLPLAQADIAKVVAKVGGWQAGYAGPTIRRVQATGRPFVSPDVERGKADFDDLRHTLNSLQAYLAGRRAHAVRELSSSARTLNIACIGIAVTLLLIVALLTLAVRAAAIRPLTRLAEDVRQVADGEFGHPVGRSGPREMQRLGADVDYMRQRILTELDVARAAQAELEVRTADLERSNSELEQFAYVASHDLQEPLRKVASFCQLLQRRYAGKLDSKADQYIELAVDGAKRMQALINDLLAFSRIGRIAREREPVSTGALLSQAWANLSTRRKRPKTTLAAGDLPVVLAEGTLLTAVFQNLLSNSLKFHGAGPTQIEVSARRGGEFWIFSFSDNGIGIDPEYAERIFVIFQRLHDKEAYPGTGIGLAMCRKIIEYHGGRIWLDTSVQAGARFCFTLPALPEEDDGADDRSD